MPSILFHMLDPKNPHTVKPEKSKYDSYAELRPYEVIFNGMLIYHDDGRVSIRETQPDRFMVFSGAQNLLWGCVMFRGAEPLFPYTQPTEIKFGEDFWPWSIAWMLFLKKAHPLTGKTYPSGKAIDVGLVLAAGSLEKLKDFVAVSIDDQSRQVSLGYTYQSEIKEHLDQHKEKIKEMEKLVSQLQQEKNQKDFS